MVQSETTFELMASAALPDARPQPTTAQDHADALHRATSACGLFIVLIGVFVLAGWLFSFEPFMTVLRGFVRMKANTAIGFVVSGLALASVPAGSGRPPAFNHRPGRIWSGLLAGLTFALGALTLVEYVGGANLHIDELLFRDSQALKYPGRMASISAICFCLAGASLLLELGGRRARQLSQACALLLALTASAAIISYLYGVSIFYGSLANPSMALHAGVGFLVLGVGLTLARPESMLVRVLSAEERGGWLGRRLIGVVILLPVVLGWVYLRPALNFGELRFAIALFAVTLSVTSAAGLLLLAMFLNRAERQQADLLRLQEESSAKVRQSERELRLVTDHLPTLLSYIDLSGRFLRVNRTYERWMGLGADKIVGKSIRELLGDAYWDRSAPAREAVSRGETITFETAYPTVHGERRAQITYAPDLDEEGRVRGIACMVLDVEEYRQAESALRMSEKLAVVGRMASSIAHEINNPLEAVTNLLYLAAGSISPEREEAEYVALAQEQLKRVSHIVIETLRFHRQASDPVACHVSELVEQVLVLHQGRLAHNGIVVERRFRDPAPLLCRNGEVRQVLANLIGNAADAMSSGGRLLVRVREAGRAGDHAAGVVITIADSGHGIKPATRDTLFEPFQTTKGETGSGLGLWISKEIVERHGGRLSLRSRVAAGDTSTEKDRTALSGALPRSGTVFRVTLPAVVAPPPR